MLSLVVCLSPAGTADFVPRADVPLPPELQCELDEERREIGAPSASASTSGPGPAVATSASTAASEVSAGLWLTHYCLV